MSSSMAHSRGQVHLHAREGDARVLFARHGVRLQALVNRRVDTSRANVEDAFAFAWLQLCRYRPRGERVFGWLFRTAVREAQRLDRRAGTALHHDDPDAASTHDHASQVGGPLVLLAARETITAAGLSEREARLVGLRAVGYSYRESAQLTGQSVRTVERQLVRADRELRNARRAEREAWR